MNALLGMDLNGSVMVMSFRIGHSYNKQLTDLVE